MRAWEVESEGPIATAGGAWEIDTEIPDAARPLPAGVTPSSAGAGRGSVNPPLPKGRPQGALAAAADRPPAEPMGMGMPQQEPQTLAESLMRPAGQSVPLSDQELADAETGQTKAGREQLEKRRLRELADASRRNAPSLLPDPGADRKARQAEIKAAQPKGVIAGTAFEVADTALDAGRGAAKVVPHLAKNAWDVLRFGADVVGADEFARFAAASSKAGDKALESLDNPNGDHNMTGAIQSLGTALFGVALRGASGAIALGSGQSGADKYSEARNMGFDIGASTEAAVVFGFAEYLGERVSIPSLGRMVWENGVMRGLKPADALKEALKQQGGEQGTQVLQSLYDKFGRAGSDPNMTWEKYLDQAVDVAKQTAIMSGVAHGAGKVSGAMQRRAFDQGMQLLEQTQAELGALAPGVLASQARNTFDAGPQLTPTETIYQTDRATISTGGRPAPIQLRDMPTTPLSVEQVLAIAPQPVEQLPGEGSETPPVTGRSLPVGPIDEGTQNVSRAEAIGVAAVPQGALADIAERAIGGRDGGLPADGVAVDPGAALADAGGVLDRGGDPPAAPGQGSVPVAAGAPGPGAQADGAQGAGRGGDAALTPPVDAGSAALLANLKPKPAMPPIPRDSDLSPESKAIEGRLADKLTAGFDAAVSEYEALPDSEGGKILNTDIARELSEDYTKNRGLSAAVHEPASWFVKQLYARKLKALQPGQPVIFTSGGTGAGKTSAINESPAMKRLKDAAGIVYDTNMSTFEPARKKIDQALSAGALVMLMHVQRDPVESLVVGALPRAMHQAERFGTGRTVPLAEHAKTHRGAAEVLPQLVELYKDDPRVAVHVVDNTRGKRNSRLADLDFVRGFDYNGLEGKLSAALDEAHRSGDISDDVYRATSGRDATPKVEPRVRGGGRAELERADGQTARRLAHNDTEAGEVAPAEPAPPAPVLQNRNRSEPAYIGQMAGIAADPDPDRLSFSRDFSSGAPVILNEPVAGMAMGSKERVTAASGRKITVQYAAVEADTLLPSNTVDGSANKGYTDGKPGKARVVAGNGRAAGLQAAYERGNAAAYKKGIAADAALHGVPAGAIEGMKRPVLVRVMRSEDVTGNIGDESNVSGIAEKSALEKAKDDARRLNLESLDFDENGDLTSATVRQFVDAMPVSEQTALRDPDGSPTRQAQDRITAAVFWQAYESEALVRLFAQATDPESKVVMNGLAVAAPQMMRLRDAGALDIRSAVADAAGAAINAKRRGIKLADYAAQGDMDLHPDAASVLRMLAENGRSAKKVGEILRAAATLAHEEASKPSEDIFGPVDKLSRAQILGAIHESASKADLAQQGGRQSDDGAPQGVAEPGAQGDARGAQARGSAEAGEYQLATSVAGLALREKLAPFTARQADEFSLDLFPDTVPADRGARRAPMPGRASAAGNVPAPNTVSVRPDAAMPGVYNVTSQLVEVGKHALPVERVKTWADAALALSAMSRFSVEHFDMLITDKNGKPLAVVGSFKGAVSQTSVYPATVLAEALRIKGAAFAWAVHNHPSGQTELSRADENLSRAMALAFDPSTVKYQGVAAVGRRAAEGLTFTAIDEKNVRRFSGTLPEPGPALFTVPIVERTIVLAGARDTKVIDSPSEAKRLGAAIADGKPGIIFLNAQREITAWVPVDPQAVTTLRVENRYNALINSAAEAGASAALLMNPGGIISSRGADNIASALQLSDIRLLDMLDPDSGTSAAERGNEPNRGMTVFQRTPDRAADRPADLIELRKRVSVLESLRACL